LIKLFKKPT